MNARLSLLLAGLPATLCAADGGKTQPGETSRPNIIFILTDDMGYADIGAYGGGFVPTPNIDRMAVEGIRFTQYYSGSPISSPSRASLITGMNPGCWNITSFLQTREGNRNAEMADYLSIEAPSLPRMMQSAGYATAHFGKWHLGGGRDVKNAPMLTEYGYDEYSSTYESPDPDPLLTATDWIWSKQDSVKRWDRTAYFVDKTLDFLKRNSGKPCFVNLWPDDMHTPWVGNFEEQMVFPDGQESEKNFKTVLAEYDRQIGRLLDGIRQLGLEENTLVIFTSDNGPAPSFRGSRAGGFRGCKASLFEGGIRMPFIVWGYGVEAGKVDDSSVICAVDIPESICSMASVPMPKNYAGSGMDRCRVILGSPQKRNQPLFWEYRRNASNAFPKPYDKDISPNVAMRDGKWKLLINGDGSDAMLYDLSADPGETNNLAAKNPSVVRKMQKQALEWFRALPPYRQ